MQTNAGAPLPPIILADNIEISRDPRNWTSLTNGQMLKLLIKPEDATRQVVDYAGRRFISYLDSDEAKSHVFYLQEGKFFTKNDVPGAWYILARPKTDPLIYEKPLILADDIRISKDPLNWTSLTNGQMSKLLIKPEDATRQVVDYAGRRFISDLDSDEARSHVFYLQKGKFATKSDVPDAWYILAREKTDPFIYERSKEPY